MLIGPVEMRGRMEQFGVAVSFDAYKFFLSRRARDSTNSLAGATSRDVSTTPHQESV